MTIKCPSCGHQFDPSQGVDHHVKESSRLAGLEQGRLLERQAWENQTGTKQTAQELENIRLKGLLQQLDGSKEVEKAQAVLDAQMAERQNSSLEIATLKKRNADIQILLDEATRKGAQGSQQLQGAALQLTVEAILRKEFEPEDLVTNVSTGAKGADHLLMVRTALGRECQSIKVEDKSVKDWSNNFPVKLKEDMLRVGAVHGVIVTTKMPKDLPNGGSYGDCIWVVSPSNLVTLMRALRDGIEAVAIEVARQDISKDTAQLVFEYVTSEAFRQRVVAFLGYFSKLEGEERLEENYMAQRRAARRETYRLISHHFNSMLGSLQANSNTPPLLESEN